MSELASKAATTQIPANDPFKAPTAFNLIPVKSLAPSDDILPFNQTVSVSIDVRKTQDQKSSLEES